VDAAKLFAASKRTLVDLHAAIGKGADVIARHHAARAYRNTVEHMVWRGTMLLTALDEKTKASRLFDNELSDQKDREMKSKDAYVDYGKIVAAVLAKHAPLSGGGPSRRGRGRGRARNQQRTETSGANTGSSSNTAQQGTSNRRN
jgi:hypothetical protein